MAGGELDWLGASMPFEMFWEIQPGLSNGGASTAGWRFCYLVGCED